MSRLLQPSTLTTESGQAWLTLRLWETRMTLTQWWANSSVSTAHNPKSKMDMPLTDRLVAQGTAIQKELEKTEPTGRGKPRCTETKKKARESTGTRPLAQETPKAKHGKGTNMWAATTLTGYLGCLLHMKCHQTARTLATKKHTRERRTDGEEKKGEQREPGTTEEAKESESGEVSERERERESQVRSSERTWRQRLDRSGVMPLEEGLRIARAFSL